MVKELNIISGKNITEVFYQSLEKLQNEANYYTKDNILELTPALIHVGNPRERCLVIPYRNNNIVQTIAETLWVLGGRNDLKYLSKYLPKADWFSDDGETWRGGYGTRLRSWFGGVDQIKKVITVLRGDQFSARGIMVIFDPKEDIDLNLKDVPCNNWIQLSIRDNKLNMYVTLRANDLIWGFSGINFFEWSVLQELVSNWLNVEVGEYYHFTGFLQLYRRHFNRAKLMMQHKIERDIYNFDAIEHIGVDLSEEKFEQQMSQFFDVEKNFMTMSTSLVLDELEKLDSEFLKHCGKLMFSYLLFQNKSYKDFIRIFSDIKEDHCKIAAAYNYKRFVDKDTEIHRIFDEILSRYQLNEIA